MLSPDFQKKGMVFDDSVNISTTQSEVDTVLVKTFTSINDIYVLTCLDLYPDKADAQWKVSPAALEASLRSQGVYEFLVDFLLMWIALRIGLRRKYRLSLSAAAATE